jgi:capsule biosynthesis phosphatase
MEKSTFVMDVDGTICVADKYPNGKSGNDYANARPIWPVIQRIRKLKEEGHTIILHTARGMRTYSGDVEQVRLNVLPVLLSWLHRHDVPYDDIKIGKPWGPNVYYIDDRALSPSDFVRNDAVDYESVTLKRLINP